MAHPFGRSRVPLFTEQRARSSPENTLCVTTLFARFEQTYLVLKVNVFVREDVMLNCPIF